MRACVCACVRACVRVCCGCTLCARVALGGPSSIFHEFRISFGRSGASFFMGNRFMDFLLRWMLLEWFLERYFDGPGTAQLLKKSQNKPGPQEVPNLSENVEADTPTSNKGARPHRLENKSAWQRCRSASAGNNHQRTQTLSQQSDKYHRL